MLDVSVSYNRYKFLGYEFLTWLWFVIEKDRNKLIKLEKDPISLGIGNRLVLENRLNDTVESITIKGDDAGLEEGILSLRKGAVVTELNLSYKSGDQEWRFTIKGESLDLSSLKVPDTGPIESREDIEGAVIEKAFMYDKVIRFIDNIFNAFIKLRVSNDWNNAVVPAIKKWIYS